MNLPVRAFSDPLLGLAGEVREYWRPPNATLADLVGYVELPHEALRPFLRVKLEGELIDPQLYRLIRPKGDCRVTIVLAPQGGKGSSFLVTLAAIALVGASLFVGGFGLPFLGSAFAAGSVGANLVSAGLSLSASLLLQGLNAPNQASSDSSAREVGVASAQNTFEPGAYLQRVMGSRRVAPQMVMPPFTTLDGDDQLVTVVVGLAGPHAISDIRLGTGSIAEAEDVEYEVREGLPGDLPLTLLTDTRVEVALGIKLSQFRMLSNVDRGNRLDTSISPYVPLWHRLETKRSPDIFTVFVSFDQGLLYLRDDSGTGPSPAVTALRFRIRRKGTTTWYQLPEFVIRGQKASGAMRLQMDFEWRATASMPGAVTAFAPTYGGFSWMFNTVENSPTFFWQADPYFASNKVDHISDQRLKVYLDTATFPQDTYEIEVRRGQTVHDGRFTVDTATAYHLTTPPGNPNIYTFFGAVLDGSGNYILAYAQDAYSHQISIASVQSVWAEYPFDFADQPTALIALRARNRSIDQVNCIASGYVADWNGSTWADNQVSANPASWYRHALLGDHTAEPYDPTLVDLPNFEDWHPWCKQRGYEVNAIIQGRPLDEVLKLIALCGFARPRRVPLEGVVMERARPARGLITLRNSQGVGFAKAFGRLPHAVRPNLPDVDNDYQVRELTEYAPGYGAIASAGVKEAVRFESLSYEGIVYEDQMRERAQLDQRFARYRATAFPLTLDIEHLDVLLGDRFLLETDVVGVKSGRARVTGVTIDGGSGLVTGLTLDEERAFPIGFNDDFSTDYGQPRRGAVMRLADGTLRTEELTQDDGDASAIAFTTPFAMPVDAAGGDLLEEGTLLVTGEFGAEARDIIIWDIAKGAGLTAQLTLVDYAGDVFYPDDFGLDFSDSDFAAGIEASLSNDFNDDYSNWEL